LRLTALEVFPQLPRQPLCARGLIRVLLSHQMQDSDARHDLQKARLDSAAMIGYSLLLLAFSPRRLP
jgi:hypothetical protein